VLRVTLREQAKFEAEIYEIGSRQDFWRAESDLHAADASLGPESWGGVTLLRQRRGSSPRQGCQFGSRTPLRAPTESLNSVHS
jgi:hypothetical protein